MRKEVFEKIWDQKNANKFSERYIKLYMDIFEITFGQIKPRDIIISALENAVEDLEPITREAIMLRYGFKGITMKKSKIEWYMKLYPGKYNDLEKKAFQRLRCPIYTYTISEKLKKLEREYKSKVKYINAVRFQSAAEIDLDDLKELSLRTKTLLVRNNITSLGDLMSVSKEKLNSIHGFGKKSMEEFESVKERFTFE